MSTSMEIRKKIINAVEKELAGSHIPPPEAIVSMDVYLRVSFFVEEPVIIDVQVKLDERE